MTHILEKFYFESLCNDGEFNVQVTDNGNVVFSNDKLEAENIHFGISREDFIELIKYYKSKLL